MKKIFSFIIGFCILTTPTFAINKEKYKKLSLNKDFSFKEEKGKRLESIERKKFSCDISEDLYVHDQVIVKFKSNPDLELFKNTNLKALSKKPTINYEMEAMFPEPDSGNSKALVLSKRILKAKQLRKELGLDRIHLIKLQNPDEDIEPCQRILDLIEELEKDPNVEYAEPSYLAKPLKTTNDPLYNPGSNHNGLWNLRKVNAQGAWDYATGKGVQVAVIDTSTDMTHPDLVNNIYNPNLNFPYGFTHLPGFHGTHVSGTIAASGNNSRGVVGIAYGAGLIPVGYIEQELVQNLIKLSEAVYAAVNAGADVLNLSIGISSYSQTDKIAFDYARDMGVISVAAACNYDPQVSSAFPYVCYPGAYETVLAVSNTDENDRRNQSSNYGSWIDVAAPGTNILSTTSIYTCSSYSCPELSKLKVADDQYYGYAYGTGTSMSSPLVAGLIALLKSYWTGLTREDIFSCLVYGTDEINTDAYIGVGRINAKDSLELAVATKTLKVIDSNNDGSFSDQELISFINAQEQAQSRYSYNFDMNNDGVCNSKDIELNTMSIALIEGLQARIDALIQGSEIPEDDDDITDLTEAKIDSITILDDFVTGDITSQGKTLIKFRVNSSGSINGQNYVPKASEMRLEGDPIIAIDGKVNEFLAMVDFSKGTTVINQGVFSEFDLRYIAGQSSKAIAIKIPITIGSKKKYPQITASKILRNDRIYSGKNFQKRGGSFGYVLSDGTFETVSYKVAKNRKSIKVSQFDIPSNAIYALYHLPKIGVSIYAN